MDRADLDAALSFVERRIAQQAVQSGEPLSEDQNLLLKYLPSSIPQVSDPEGAGPQPRHRNYERLCELGKAAYLNDRKANPESLDWEFAFAVFELNHHLMWGLLQNAGLKARRPWWDGLLLIGAALFILLVTILLADKAPLSLYQLAGFGSGSLAVVLMMCFASRRMQERQLEEQIERCRLSSHFVNGAVGDSSASDFRHA